MKFAPPYCSRAGGAVEEFYRFNSDSRLMARFERRKDTGFFSKQNLTTTWLADLRGQMRGKNADLFLNATSRERFPFGVPDDAYCFGM